MLICTLESYSQDAKETKKANTKMEQFGSKTGVIARYEDFKSPKLKLNYGLAETKYLSRPKIG